MWAIARYDLRLSDADFQRLTARQLMGLMERDRQRRDAEDLRTGNLYAIIANFSMGKDPDTDPLTAHDFFPHLPKVESEPRRMSGEEMYGFIRGFRNRRAKG